MNTFNRNNLIKVNIMLKIMMIAVFYPVLMAMIRIMIRCAGMTYLANTKVAKFFAYPTTWIGVLCIGVIACLLCVVEQQLIMAGYDGMYGDNLSKSYIVANGLKSLKNVFKFRNLFVLFASVVVVVVMNGTVIVHFVMNVLSVNGYLSSYLKRHGNLRLTLVGVILLLVYVAVRYFFVAAILYNKGCTGREAIEENKQLVKQHLFRIIRLIIVYNLIVLFSYAILYVLVSVIVRIGVDILDIEHAGIAVFLTILKYFTSVISIVFFLISIPMSEIVLARCYYQCIQERPVVREAKEWTKGKTMRKLVLVAFMLDAFYLFLFLNGNYVKQTDFMLVTKVVAHRGSSVNLPENTMVAFEQAVADFTDMIELDVRQTKDGQFVIMHDENLRRTTGINRKVGEMTQQAICTLYAGRTAGLDIEHANVPSLEEVMEFAKANNVRINFEIKTAKTDSNYVLAFYKMLSKYGMIDGNVVTSKDYEALVQLKAIDPRIKTGYILTMGLGKYYNKMKVDFYSVKSEFVTVSMINALHAQNKEIHVWTLNDEKEIIKYASMGADYIITDEPLKAREAIYSKDTPNIIKNLVDYVFGK